MHGGLEDFWKASLSPQSTITLSTRMPEQRSPGKVGRPPCMRQLLTAQMPQQLHATTPGLILLISLQTPEKDTPLDKHTLNLKLNLKIKLTSESRLKLGLDRSGNNSISPCMYLDSHCIWNKVWFSTTVCILRFASSSMNCLLLYINSISNLVMSLKLNCADMQKKMRLTRIGRPCYGSCPDPGKGRVRSSWTQNFSSGNVYCVASLLLHLIMNIACQCTLRTLYCWIAFKFNIIQAGPL